MATTPRIWRKIRPNVTGSGDTAMQFTMNNEIRSRLQLAGFEIIGHFSKSEPSAMKAFHRVVHVETRPVEIIPCYSTDIAERVNTAWHAHARDFGVIADDGSFLVLGSLADGWIQVRLTETADIFATHDQSGDLLFIARSLSGGRVCAVSEEGSDYWIIEEKLS
ncbi:hypothetical protein ACWEN3_07690 [Streptomyces sp. NPDC004561]